jgi:cold shock CspA family protein
VVDRRSGRRAVGTVKAINVDRGWAFLTETGTGEEFFLAKKAMSYEEDFDKLVSGDQVLFVTAPATNGKFRQATVALKAGTYADGTLAAWATDRPYGFITVQDSEGNKHLIYLAVTEETRRFKTGDELTFKVVATARGARAEDVSLAGDGEGDEPATDLRRFA